MEGPFLDFQGFYMQNCDGQAEGVDVLFGNASINIA